MSSDILRIIEGGLNNDRRKIISYSNRLATRLEAEGNIQLARCIKEQIQTLTQEVLQQLMPCVCYL